MALDSALTSTTAKISPTGQISDTAQPVQSTNTPIVLPTDSAVESTQSSLDKLATITALKDQSTETPPVPPSTPTPNTPPPSSQTAYSIAGLSPDIQAQLKASTPNVGDEYILPNGDRIQKTSSGSYVQAGATTAQPSATIKTGNDAIDAEIAKHQANVDSYNAEIASVKSQMTALQNGTFLNPMTQNLLNNINAMYDQTIAKQEQVNKAVLGGYTQAGIRSGRSRYAPEIETGNLNKVMSDGLAKISDLQTKKASAIAKAQQAATDSDFNQLYTEMSLFETHAKNETTAMVDLLKQVNDETKAAAQAQKDKLANIKTQQDIDQKAAASAAYTVFNFIEVNPDMSADDIKKSIQEYATANDLNPNSLLNEVQKLETTKNKFYGTGTIGEYNFAKDKGGFTGSYQNWLEYKKSLGKTSPANKEFSFTPKQKMDLQSQGLKDEDLTGILQDLKNGVSADKIKTQMQSNGLDPKLLDSVLGYIKP